MQVFAGLSVSSRDERLRMLCVRVRFDKSKCCACWHIGDGGGGGWVMRYCVQSCLSHRVCFPVDRKQMVRMRHALHSWLAGFLDFA